MTALDAKILILDDEPGVLDVLGQHLTGLGHSCRGTSSAQEALDILAREDHALLLTDLRMPEMNGMEVVSRAKKMCPDLCIVVVTALGEVSNAIQALRMGADDYILKPFDLQDITMAVTRALEKRQAAEVSRNYQEELEQRIHNATEDLAGVNRELRKTKQYLENLLHSTVDGIITLDLEDRVEFANAGALRMSGYTEEEFTRLTGADLFAGGEEELSYVKRMLRDDQPLQNHETGLRHRNGSVIPVNISFSLVRGADGQIASMLAICKDITKQKQLEDELKELSIKDGLTGLYNQRYFHDRLKAEIERARRQSHPLSLLLFDIDGFKQYNDCHGHLEGDKVLQDVGRAVRECTRDHVDIGFRYGGDEFTVILPEADDRQAQGIAERIRRLFAEEHHDNLTLSIGVLPFDEGYSQRAFTQLADNLMYEAKRAGGNRVSTPKPGATLVPKDNA